MCARQQKFVQRIVCVHIQHVSTFSCADTHCSVCTLNIFRSFSFYFISFLYFSILFFSFYTFFHFFSLLPFGKRTRLNVVFFCMLAYLHLKFMQRETSNDPNLKQPRTFKQCWPLPHPRASRFASLCPAMNDHKMGWNCCYLSLRCICLYMSMFLLLFEVHFWPIS